MIQHTLSNRFTYLVLLFCFMSCTLFSQDFSRGNFKKDDSLSFFVSDLERLDTLITATDTTYPYYRLFYIYGDGDYATHSTKGTGQLIDTALHRFPLQAADGNFAWPPHFNPRVYALKIYSNGLPPPDRMQVRPPVERYPQGSTEPVEIKKLIQVDGKTQTPYLDITTHAQAKMGEPLILVLAVRNSSSVTISNANLFLLFDSDIAEYAPVGRDRVLTLQPASGNFSEFPIEDVLVHTDKANRDALVYNTSNINTEDVSNRLPNHYQKMLAFQLNNLIEGEEEHIFLEVTVDSTNFDRFSSEHLATVNFTTVLVSNDTSLGPNTPTVTQVEQSFLDSIGFTDALPLIAGQDVQLDSFYQYDALQDTTRIFNHTDVWGIQGGATFLDVAIQQVNLVKGHDPNFLLAQACKCPNTETRNKLFITVQAENDGFTGVQDIYYDIMLPEGITAADIDTNAIAVHPGDAREKITFKIIDGNPQHIRWAMKGRLIQSINDFGVGHPDTYAQIQFQAFTDMAPSSFDSLLIACIRFDDENSDEVMCTYPNAVELLTEADSESLEILTCFDCNDDPVTDCVPWWVWLIIILVIFIAIGVVWYDIKNNEP